MRNFFPRELREAKVCEFLTLKQDYLNAYYYGLKFTKISRYAPEMVKDMRTRMCLFVASLGRSSSKNGCTSMLIWDIYILRLMICVMQIEVGKTKRQRGVQEKRAKTGNESGK